MEYRLKDKSRVKLRGYIDPTFYNGMAKVGNEGWITQHRLDKHGLPEVYIQWDRLHWADNKQPDGWTYEEHFDLVEEFKPMTEPNDDKLKALWRLLEGFFTDQIPSQSSNQEETEGYQASVSQTLEGLPGSEAFLAIVVDREPSPEAPEGRLGVNLYGNALSPEAHAVIGIHLSQLAAKFHQEAAIATIQRITEEK